MTGHDGSRHEYCRRDRGKSPTPHHHRYRLLIPTRFIVASFQFSHLNGAPLQKSGLLRSSMNSPASANRRCSRTSDWPRLRSSHWLDQTPGMQQRSRRRPMSVGVREGSTSEARAFLRLRIRTLGVRVLSPQSGEAGRRSPEFLQVPALRQKSERAPRLPRTQPQILRSAVSIGAQH